ncbi:MAG: hypothetical protein Q7S73_01125 [bacterium]|jgi:hypothetical protein|nr:hypothetical protein [bacterium]
MPEIPLFVQSLLFYLVIGMSAIMAYLSFGLIILKLVLDLLIKEELQKEIGTSEANLLKMMVVWPVALLWILYKWLGYRPLKNEFKNGL